jgi:phosphatidylserine synthase
VGPFQTIGFTALLCWIAAGVALPFNNPRFTRRLVVVSMVVTASLVPISRVFATDRPTLGFLAFLFVLGLPILISQPESIKGSQSDRLTRTLIIASLVVGALVALVLVPNWDGSALNRYSRGTYGLSPSLIFYEVSLRSVAAWLLWPASAAIIASAALHALGRRVLAGCVAFSGLPLLVLWLGVPNGFEDWVHLLVGTALAATCTLLVGVYVVNPHERAATQA